MKTLNLFIFIDALGWKIAKERQFLADVLPYRSPCNTIFGYSSTCDPTILTGELPEKHGHFSFYAPAAEEQPFKGWGALRFLPSFISEHRRVRNRLSHYIAKKRGYTGYFQLYSMPFKYLPYFDYTEKKDIYMPGGIIGGQKTIFDSWQASGRAWFRSDWRQSDAVNLRALGEVVTKAEVELAYLFTAGLDALMHRYGTQGPEVDQGFAEFEAQLRGLIIKARKYYKDVRVHAFSDHGMANTQRSSNLRLRFEKLGYRFGRDYIACWDSTMARFWFPGGAAVKAQIEAYLRYQLDGRILSDAELKLWGCLFPDNKYGELFYLLPAGSIFVPSFMNKQWVNGMHGYDPSHPDSAASWLTSHPSRVPKSLVDIFPIMQAACHGDTGVPWDRADEAMQVLSKAGHEAALF